MPDDKVCIVILGEEVEERPGGGLTAGTTERDGRGKADAGGSVGEQVGELGGQADGAVGW